MTRPIRNTPDNLWAIPAAVACLILTVGADALGHIPAIFRAFDGVAVVCFGIATLFALVGNIQTLESLLEAPNAPGSLNRVARLAAAATVGFLFFWSLDVRDAPVVDPSVPMLVSVMALVLLAASVASLRRDVTVSTALPA